MNKSLKKILTTTMCMLLLVNAVACDGGQSSSLEESSNSSSESTQQTTVDASLKFAMAEDKILQSYEGNTMVDLKEKFMGSLADDFSIVAFKNEYETKQLVITPETDVNNYKVTVGDFACGTSKIPATAFDVRHMYYHKVESIYDAESEMLPGMYPDALLPMDTAIAYGKNKIKAGENQGVYITVKVPKEVPAGVYTGDIKVELDNSEYTVQGQITVLDYTLPDTVSIKSCIPTQPGYLFQGELDDTQDMYDKIADSLKEFRLGIQYLESYYISSASDEELTKFVLDIATDKAVEATKDPAVPSYAIKCYEIADTVSGRTDFNYVLNTTLFEKSLKAYVDKSIEAEVNLFEKAYVYMGNIIDEPDLGGQVAWDRANFVCQQYEQTILKVVSYAESVGAPIEVVEDLANLQNVVTGAYSQYLYEITSYCPTIDKLEMSQTRDDYAELRESGKDYWWYTCTVPKVPYPTVHIDDNGVSSRVMSWMAHEYDVSGYLTWESVYYMMYDGYTTSPLSGIELYDNVHRWPDAYGDGFFYYPGKVFGLDTPVPCMRLYNIRDGLEDYEAMVHLEKMYAELSETYGEEISASGVLNELYALLYDDVKVYCTSADIAQAKEILGQLLVMAEDGIAVSNLEMLSNSDVSAKVYAPTVADVTVSSATASSKGTYKVFDVLSKLETFSVTSSDASFSFNMKGNIISTPLDTSRITVHTNTQAELTMGVNKQVNDGCVDVTMPSSAASLRYKLDEKFLTSKSNSLILYVNSSANKPIEVSVSLLGNNKMVVIDTIYIYPGDNIIRFDRIGDLNWKSLKQATHIILGFSLDNTVTFSFENVVVK